MIDRLAVRIYDLVAGHIDMDESARKMKRLYTCTDDTARQKCRNFYTGIIKNILFFHFIKSNNQIFKESPSYVFSLNYLFPFFRKDFPAKNLISGRTITK